MTIEWKKTLLEFLDVEIEKARIAALKTDEASKFVLTGYSQAGDKYHSQKAAELTEKYLQRLKKLREEVYISDDEIKTQAYPISCVDVEYDEGPKLRFILVNTAVSLTRFLFISKDSPLGKAILGKKEGDEFSYNLDKGGEKKLFSGKILRIE